LIEASIIHLHVFDGEHSVCKAWPLDVACFSFLHKNKKELIGSLLVGNGVCGEQQLRGGCKEKVLTREAVVLL